VEAAPPEWSKVIQLVSTSLSFALLVMMSLGSCSAPDLETELELEI
jgi:hypothetical protein